jgi:UDP-N-acetylmuramoyl-tripeptide--D-alanyl-D-alanine ligase
MNTLWTSHDLRAATGGRLDADVSVRGVSIDTRTIMPGDLFIALVGERDGHDHVADAFAKGAACALVHRADMRDPRCLLVGDTMTALVALACYARARFSGRVVAVTGSVGKTTTKDMLRVALASYGAAHASVASYNNHWGVPLTLARLPEDAAYCISEIGMNHAGEIAPLATLVRPDVAVITTVGSSHIGNMGSIGAIAAEKASLFSALGPDGIAIIPDDAPCEDILAAAAAHVTLERAGTSDAATNRAINVSCDETGSTFVFADPDETLAVRLNEPGEHLVRNAVSALAVVHALGLDPHAAAAALAEWSPGAGRGLRRPILDGTAILLDESYNASVLSVRASLRTLALLPATRRIAVLGDMLEMGDFADEAHRSLASDLVASADLVFCCGTQMKALFDCLPDRIRAGYAPDSAALAPMVRATLAAGDCVLVKGSLGSRMARVVAALDTAKAAA